MKSLILSLAFISFFSSSKSMAQVASTSTRIAEPIASREVSNYNSNANNSGGAGNYTARTEASFNSQPQAVSYRNDAPVASSFNVNAVNTNISASSNTYYSTNYPSGYNPTHINNTQTTIRYNYAARGVYPYYHSAKAKKENHKQHKDFVHQSRLHHFYKRPLYISFNDFYPTPSFLCDQPVYYNTDFLANNSALNVSLDGYVVYGKDTLSGIVTITHDAILLEQSIDSNGENGYKFSYKDYSMKSVVVYYEDEELYLSRTSAKGELLRVLHTGKLTIYDDVYSFLDGYNVDELHMKLAYDGKLKSPGSFVTFDIRIPLIKAVNKAYGLHLKTEDMGWYNLLYYINTLD